MWMAHEFALSAARVNGPRLRTTSARTRGIGSGISMRTNEKPRLRAGARGERCQLLASGGQEHPACSSPRRSAVAAALRDPAPLSTCPQASGVHSGLQYPQVRHRWPSEQARTDMAGHVGREGMGGVDDGSDAGSRRSTGPILPVPPNPPTRTSPGGKRKGLHSPCERRGECEARGKADKRAASSDASLDPASNRTLGTPSEAVVQRSRPERRWSGRRCYGGRAASRGTPV